MENFGIYSARDTTLHRALKAESGKERNTQHPTPNKIALHGKLGDLCFALRKTPGEGFPKTFPALLKRRDFVRCGGRPKALPLETASLLKKA